MNHRIIVAIATLMLGCGSSAANTTPPQEAVSAQEPEQGAFDQSPGGTCEPDPEPIAIASGDVAVETQRGENEQTLMRIALRDGSNVRGARCTREYIGGEIGAETETEHVLARIGDSDVLVVTEWAEWTATCREVEGDDDGRCGGRVAIAWVLDRQLALIGQVGAESPTAASVEGGVLTVGELRRTIQGGQLADAP